MPKEVKSRVPAIISALSAISSIISTLFMLLLVVLFISLFAGSSLKPGNVAIIPIVGEISATGDGFSAAVSSTDILSLLREADNDKSIVAILLEINSPGGAPVASAEIAQAVRAANKTVVAVIRDEGASGAYWIASAADVIFAHPMSVTGSIGVTASYLEFAGLLQRYNVTYRQLMSGKYKDVGSPYREMTPEEKRMFQQQLDNVRDVFISEVAAYRNLPKAKVEELATGFIYLGTEAKELGLVDRLGTEDDAIKYIEEQFKIVAEPVEFSPQKGLFAALSGAATKQSYSVGRGIGDSLKTQEKTPLPSLRRS
ncbi:signal peptide peptidase SppA [Candidatus Woesearchaeota archaeon]|nr:signal peptide peptidase SppA [Candidatus Woesearchaeota archaeon]